MAKAKLKSALNRYQGKDYKLERQKKLQKQAEKKRKAKEEQQENDEILGEAGDDALEAIAFDANGEAEDSAEWESEEDDGEESMGFDLSRLNESDSDSELGDDDDDEEDVGEDLTPQTDSTVTKNEPAMLVTAAEDDIPLSDLSAASDDEDIVPHQRLTINNTAALQRALSSIALPVTKLPFSEHQSVTTSEPINIADVEDELNRELAFYAQSLSSAKAARSLLRKEGTPFTRPADYFAEMVKSDEHMGKVKAKLVDEAASKKASQEARRQRDLKKFGKQVQQEKLKERAQQKKEMLDKVKLLKRKRQSGGVEGAGEEDIFDIALDDAATSDRKEKRSKTGARGAGGQFNPKRAKKNEKFGFGGKKKFKKSGDAISSGDMRGFSTKKMKGQTGGSKRLGKSRRSKV